MILTQPIDGHIVKTIENWPEDKQDRWEERASIIEYHGKLKRHEAEQQAFIALGGVIQKDLFNG